MGPWFLMDSVEGGFIFFLSLMYISADEMEPVEKEVEYTQEKRRMIDKARSR